MNEFEVVEQKTQPVAAIKIKTSIDKLPKIIGESYMKIMAYLDEIGEKPVDAPYAAYYNMDMQNLEVELGFPVSKEIPRKDDIMPGRIPAGKMVTTLYKGPYSGMEKVYNDLFKWLGEKGYEASGVYYEYYFNSPMEVPESELLTKIVIPLK